MEEHSPVLALSIGVAVTASGAASAQGMQGGLGQCVMHGGMGSGMMERGGRGMMMDHMLGSGSMGTGMRESVMTGRGMMQRSGSGMGALFGSRVSPPMNLSVEDVSGYLDLRLKRVGNKRLKTGEVTSEDSTITADIVTTDNSLVQRMKVDRRTGAIEYED